MSVAIAGFSGGATVPGSGGRPPAAGFTVTVTSSLDEIWLSFAVRRKTYWPLVENVAVVDATLGSAKVTVPGPLTAVHAIVRVAPGGRPSSVTVPLSVAAAGSVIVWSGPASTTGA